MSNSRDEIMRLERELDEANHDAECMAQRIRELENKVEKLLSELQLTESPPLPVYPATKEGSDAVGRLWEHLDIIGHAWKRFRRGIDGSMMTYLDAPTGRLVGFKVDVAGAVTAFYYGSGRWEEFPVPAIEEDSLRELVERLTAI